MKFLTFASFKIQAVTPHCGPTGRAFAVHLHNGIFKVLRTRCSRGFISPVCTIPNAPHNYLLFTYTSGTLVANEQEEAYVCQAPFEAETKHWPLPEGGHLFQRLRSSTSRIRTDQKSTLLQLLWILDTYVQLT